MTAVMLSLVGLIEHTAVAKGFARSTHTSAKMSCELFSLGGTSSILQVVFNINARAQWATRSLPSLVPSL